MTNPNNAIGTNAAFNGRTSPNALNDVLASFTKGIVSGWECSPKTGMTVQLGGEAGTRDVAFAENNAGDKLTINNRSGAPVEVTLNGAPATNNRVDAIVAYVDNPSTGDGSTTDNPATCGIIAVSGTVAANPTAPSEATIRSAITTDGATGGTAYYVVLATILVGTNVTTIGSGVITQGESVQSITAFPDGAVTTEKLADNAVTSEKIDWTTMSGSYSTNEQQTPFTWIDGKPIYRKTVVLNFNGVPAAGLTWNHGISNYSTMVASDIVFNPGWDNTFYSDSAYLGRNGLVLRVGPTQIALDANAASSWSGTIYYTIYYTKTTD